MSKIILNLVTQSIKTLQKELSKQELIALKYEFINIHNNKSTPPDSYFKLIQDKKISTNKLFEIEKPFYNVANHITIPPRTGTTNLLNEAYAEDVKDLSSISFLDYQQEVIGQVYDQVTSIDEWVKKKYIDILLGIKLWKIK